MFLTITIHTLRRRARKEEAETLFSESTKEYEMVMLVFIVDLPRLTDSSVKDVKQFIGKVADEYVRHSLLEGSADRIALAYITNNDDHVTNLAYETGLGNCDLEKLDKALKDSPMVLTEWGSTLSDGELQEVLGYETLYTMGEAYIEKDMLLFTSSLPDLSSEESKKVLLAAKERCVSVKFVLVDHQKAFATGEQETVLLYNTSFKYWPVDSFSYANALVKRLQDDSGELQYILFPLQANSREYNAIMNVFERDGILKMDVKILSVYRIVSPAVRARREAFIAAKNRTPLLLWYPATKAEIHSIVVNGFNPLVKNLWKVGELEHAISNAAKNQKGDRNIVALSQLSNQWNEEDFSPVYVISCGYP